MDPDEIIEYLRRVRKGDLVARTKLITLFNDYSPSDNFGFCLRIILGEFKLMFSFEPGQFRGIGPLIGLTKWLKKNHYKKDNHIYYTEYWQQLLDLRSSFHQVEVRTCADCNAEYGYAGIGGFTDLAGFNCSNCAGMYIGSLDEIDSELRCKGSQRMVFEKCPKCFSEKFGKEIVVSGYEYFFERKFIGDLGECCIDKK
jgi:hypothetical protein